MNIFLGITRAGLGLSLLVMVSACNSNRFSPVVQNAQQSSKLSEEFIQGSQPAPVDLMIVMDNSRSMVEEQDRMAERTQNLLNEIESLDWRIAFTTTDISGGNFGMQGEFLPLMGGPGVILKKGDVNARQIFSDTMKRDETLTCAIGNCPSGDEQPLAATLLALQKKDGANAGFFRAGADVMVVMITDEDERSNGASGAMKGPGLVTGVRQLLTDDQKFIVSAIVVRPGDGACHAAQQPDGNYGSIVAGAVKLTGGFLGSVCATDYANQLKSIGQLVRKAADSFELSQVPLSGDLTLTFEPAQPNTKWKLVGRKVVFTQNPPPIGTFIRANYTP